MYLESYANIDEEGDQSGPVDTTYTVTMPGKKDPYVKGDVLVDGEDVTANVQFLNADVSMDTTSRKTETGQTFKANLYVNGLYFGLAAELGAKDGYYDETDIYFLDPQNELLCQRSTMTHEDGRTFDLSKGDPVTMSELIAGKRSLLTSLSADAMIGLASISTAASEALPEEVSAMLALFNLSKKG